MVEQAALKEATAERDELRVTVREGESDRLRLETDMGSMAQQLRALKQELAAGAESLSETKVGHAEIMTHTHKKKEKRKEKKRKK